MSARQNNVINNDLYCNPVPLPNLPLGMSRLFPECASNHYTGAKCDFREVADPEIIFFEDKWYCYPSCGQVYSSSNLIDWEYQKIDIEFPLGYAPAVTQCGRNIYLSSSVRLREKKGLIFSAPHPLGPFKSLGTPKDKYGNDLENFLDPALFTDEGDRLYLYWGYAPAANGIYGMEVEAQNPTRGISDIVKVMDFDSNNAWEHYGEHGEITNYGWNEGASMFKHNGIYYFQYAACGTQYPNYSIGVYISKSPLGPFGNGATKLIGQKNGIVRGTGHGGMFRGPNGTVWQAYTTLTHRLHGYERRIGIDPVIFDENNFPHVEVSNTPRSVSKGDCGLVNVASWKLTNCSSYMYGLFGMYAVDECPHTCWVPSADDLRPTISVDFEHELDIQALRIIWAEQDLDYANGKKAAPVEFTVKFRDKNGELLDYIIDKSNNSRELNIEFLCFSPVLAQYAELTILRNNNNLHYGVIDFALFACPKDIQL